MKVFKYVVLLCFICSPVLHASSLAITHIRPYGQEDNRNAYFIDMLQLALSKTEENYGSFELKQAELVMNQSRALKSLEYKDNIDVVWTMTSIEREGLFKAIRIPLLKGLLGYRIFIIRKGTQETFSKVKTLENLKELTAGQGVSWPDMKILKANGFSVVGSTGYSTLFSMLEGGRFDYFPRGVNEPWAEIKAHQEKNLEVEKTLIIQYPAPIYFFVNKDNHKLAFRIERGLRIAIADGSFERLFRKHPANKEIFSLANIQGRRIFRLDNPLLPSQTPLHDESLWYQGD
ncbi:hypothetical protein A9Q77_03400 [Marinomonas sp. 42_23_T18]|nr:hypothetical protein A9Q77_03400 [Marinomonas sp. 42_23_T18]